VHNWEAPTWTQGQSEKLSLTEIFLYWSSVPHPVDHLRGSLSAASFLYV
jgi:hypothetical protein